MLRKSQRTGLGFKRKRTWAQWASGGGAPAKLRVSRPLKGSSYHLFENTIPISLAITSGPTAAGGNGFNMAGTTVNTSNPGLGFTYSCTSVNIINIHGGNATQSVQNPTNYDAMFNYCRLKAVKIRFAYTANVASTSLSTTVPFLPLVQIKNEEEQIISGVLPVASINLADESRTKFFQLGQQGPGSHNGFNYTHWVKTPTLYTAVDRGAANANVSRKTWLQTQYAGSTQMYGGTLLFLDCEGLLTASATTASIGTMTVYVTLYREYKDVA